MKTSWQIITLLIALALVTISIKLVMQPNKEVTEALNTEDAVYNNIVTRSSVRSYTTQEVEEEKIEKLLRAAMSAPTAGNRQPWEFVVIKDKQILNAIPPIIKGAHMAPKAPLAIAVLGSPAKALIPDYWIQDCSAATENILLAAHGMGLGAVWCGLFPENGTGRVEKMSELLELPEGTYALSLIVIGYPDREASIHDKWSPSKIHYDRY